MAKERFKVSGMQGKECKSAIECAIEAVKGVKEYVVDVDTGYVDIDYDGNYIDQSGFRRDVQNALARAGDYEIEVNKINKK